MKNLYVAGHGRDPSTGGGILNGSSSNDVLMEAVDDGREIWHHDKSHHHLEKDDLLVQEPSIFYGDLPPLTDFPCMSSSSSSSTSPAPVNAILSSSSSLSSASSSSSSAANSWAILRSDGDNLPNQRNCVESASVAALQSTASTDIPVNHQGVNGRDCVEMMDTFGYMDLLDGNDFFDAAAIFHQEEEATVPSLENPNNLMEDYQKQEAEFLVMQETGHDETIGGSGGSVLQVNSPVDQEDDLTMVFLEWLKSNKGTVSAEDLRKVKIKKATIESAAQRLGGGKEAMKQLLKLILEWIRTNHLPKRRNCCNNNHQDPFQNPNHNNPALISTWTTPPTGFVSDPGIPDLGYITAQNYQLPPPEYNLLLESSSSWDTPPPPPPHEFCVATTQYNQFPDPGFTGYMNPQSYLGTYLQGQIGDQRFQRQCSSATKEARKKRMARQRRLFSHHHHHHRHQNSNTNSNNQQNSTTGELAGVVVGDNCASTPQLNPTAVVGNWMYWTNVQTVATGTAVETSTPVADRVGSTAKQTDYPQTQRQVALDRRQGWKSEKNLQFLLQKVLKQSDVGNLGRIVLPKKEAETHLPELEARDGISLVMEDIGTSRVWHMRYRFWPNNKSRMYLLENTGDFVKTNGLQEGDFIVIYSDVKCGKYLIRGVKVRQPADESKTETTTAAPTTAAATVRRQSKSRRNNNNSSPSVNVVAY